MPTLAWIVGAAAHEIPQELGDFAILVRGGWNRTSALLANFISAATIVPGALIAYFVSTELDVTILLAFAAGNFIYIAASDLIPEVKQERRLHLQLVHAAAFAAGIGLILVTVHLLHG